MERKKKDRAFAINSFGLLPDATGDNRLDPEPALVDGKNPYAVILGRRGGLKGGKARAEKLTPAQRTAIAKKAAATRWANK